MGRPRIHNKGLPPRVVISNGAYYYLRYIDGRKRWFNLGRERRQAMMLYETMEVQHSDLLKDLKPLEELRCLPDAETVTGAGVYFLWQGARLVYVGRSKRVSTRIQQHAKAGRILFTDATALAEDPIAIHSIEAAYIVSLMPKYNRVAA